MEILFLFLGNISRKRDYEICSLVFDREEGYFTRDTCSSSSTGLLSRATVLCDSGSTATAAFLLPYLVPLRETFSSCDVVINPR